MTVGLHPRQVLLEPVVSEKSYSLTDAGKYVFRVHPDAHRTQVRQAVEALFEVHVVSVNVLTVKPKPKRRGVTRGARSGWKKAIVQLAPGEKIDIFEGGGVV